MCKSADLDALFQPSAYMTAEVAIHAVPPPPREVTPVPAAEQAGTKAVRAGDQPMPVKRDGLGIQDLVISDIHSGYLPAFADRDSNYLTRLICQDMRRRKLVGIERYGTLLLPDNGRDAIRDAVDEAVDGLFYIKQAIEEEATRQEHCAGAAPTATLVPSTVSKLGQLQSAYRAQWEVVKLLHLAPMKLLS